MGQQTSKQDDPKAPPPPPLMTNEQAEAMRKAEALTIKSLLQLADRPPLHCVFYYESQVKEGQLQMPLLYEITDPATQKGTRLVDVELWLRDQFQIPPHSSVFAVVPAEELYAPPCPLVMINTIASRLYDGFEPERVPVLHFALVVRDLALLRQPILRADSHNSPYCAISAASLAQPTDSIERKMARMRFVENMRNYGFARLQVSLEQAAIPQQAFQSVRQWLNDQLALPPTERWRDRVDVTRELKDPNAPESHPMVSLGRYVGFSCDRNREYLQLRRPIANSGTVWPPAYFEKNPEFADEMLTLLNLLDGLARDCMLAICEVLNLDTDYVMHELLDDPTSPPRSSDQVTQVDKSYQFGASVLRIYNYRNKTRADGLPVHPEDHSCGVHADLGLVTVSPVATVPGLQMWNLERMTWTDVEADAEAIHFSVFAGETLGFLTNGLIRAPLHRVPPICVASEAERRMSMPYFLRVRPEKCLNPKAEAGSQLTCRDFMEDIVFRKRPWRRDERKNAPPPDY